jgi:pimeloyl-ACP methyl ester carboxylesterase
MRPLPELPGVRHACHDLPTGVRMHVAEAGDPGAPPILAVHGWPQHWWAWRGVIPALAAAHRVICPDLRGFGWSGQPDDVALVREAHFVRIFLGTAMPPEEAAVFAGVIREPERAQASSLLYRHFQLRELPALAAGRLAGARIELVDGGHLLLDERPRLVADRARAWFA